MQVDLRLGRVVVGVEVVSDFDFAQGIHAAQQSKYGWLLLVMLPSKITNCCSLGALDTLIPLLGMSFGADWESGLGRGENR